MNVTYRALLLFLLLLYSVYCTVFGFQTFILGRKQRDVVSLLMGRLNHFLKISDKEFDDRSHNYRLVGSSYFFTGVLGLLWLIAYLTE